MTAAHQVVFSEERIQGEIARVAKEISSDFAGEDITLIGVLNGGAFFLTHLQTAIERAGLVKSCHSDYVRVASYGSGRSSGALTLTDKLQSSVEGKNVIIVDDIADTMRTLGALREYLLAQKPKRLCTAVLLEKPDKHVVKDVPLEYAGISEPGLGFLYGCGMDLDGACRGLPFVAEVTE